MGACATDFLGSVLGTGASACVTFAGVLLTTLVAGTLDSAAGAFFTGGETFASALTWGDSCLAALFVLLSGLVLAAGFVCAVLVFVAGFRAGATSATLSRVPLVSGETAFAEAFALGAVAFLTVPVATGFIACAPAVVDGASLTTVLESA